MTFSLPSLSGTARRTLTAGVLVLGVVGPLAVGTAAQAATPAAAATGTFYAYRDNDFKGPVAYFTGSDKNLTNNRWVNDPGNGVDNEISSVKNHTNRDVILRQFAASSATASCSGDAYVSLKNSEDGSLRNNNMNDKASCIQFT